MSILDPPHAVARVSRRRPPPSGRAPADIINANGGHYGALIVAEARRAGLGLAMACALVEQESSFRNIFGSDQVPNPIPHRSPVTRESYGRYRVWRDQGLGSQGVGLTQLTWKGFQDQADRLGGCWKPRNQLRVGFGVLVDHTRRHGVRGGLSAYNAGKPTSGQGLRYADQVLARRDRWRKLLAGASTPTPTPTPTPDPRPAKDGPRVIRKGARGRDVALLQRTLNRYLKRWGAPWPLDVDGICGEKTIRAFRRVRLILGLMPVKAPDGRILITPRDRIVLRHPGRRTPAEVQRARTYGRAYLVKLRAYYKKQAEQLGGRPKVIRLGLDFDQGRLARNVAIHTTVVHHSAGPVDRSRQEAVELCRRWHRMHRDTNGWAGIGYHACIARDGTLILLRPGWAVGAGVEGHNTGTYHVMLNGNFQHDEPSAAQIRTYRWFVKHGHEIPGVPRLGARQLGHRDFPGHTSNACPGNNLHAIVRGA